jgi:hypothetical protein
MVWTQVESLAQNEDVTNLSESDKKFVYVLVAKGRSWGGPLTVTSSTCFSTPEFAKQRTDTFRKLVCDPDRISPLEDDATLEISVKPMEVVK